MLKAWPCGLRPDVSRWRRRINRPDGNDSNSAEDFDRYVPVRRRPGGGGLADRAVNLAEGPRRGDHEPPDRVGRVADASRSVVSTEPTSCVELTSPRPTRGMAQLCRTVSRWPVTASAAVSLLVVGVVTGSLPSGPAPALLAHVAIGVDPWRLGRWWTLFTAPFFASGLSAYLASVLAVIVMLGVVERTVGPVRTVALAAMVQVVGSAVALVLVGAATATGGRWAAMLRESIAVGPSPLLVGCVLAASAHWPALWRRRVRVVLLVGLVMLALYSGLLPDILRLGAGVTGLVAGALAWPRVPRQRYRPITSPSRREGRVLVALIVAATAVGPVIAMLAATGIGPLAVLRFLFVSPPPDPATLAQQCLDPATAVECAQLRVRLRLTGPGPAVMSVMPVLLLLVAAEGLRRGRRAAWLGAIGLNVGLAALGVYLATDSLSEPGQQQVLLGSGTHVHAWLDLAVPPVQPLLVAVMLVLTRRWFTVIARPGVHRRWAWRISVTGLLVSVLNVVGSVAVADQYVPRPNPIDLLADLPTRFLPPGYLGETEPPFLPQGLVATLLFDWTGTVFWTVVLIAGLATFTRTAAPANASDLDRLRRILARTSGSSLAHMSTWPGHSYLFVPADHQRGHSQAPSRECVTATHPGQPRAEGPDATAVAYRVIGGVALTTGGPVGDRAQHQQAVQDFIELCQREAWTPCLYSVDAATTDLMRQKGWSLVQVAEDTVVPLEGLAFTGRKWQDVRTALNKAAKAGISAEWTTWHRAPRALTDQIQVISEEWVADKGLPEMGFTLGGLDELADDEVQLMLAIDADRTLHGVTSWLPVRHEGTTISWTLDFMRRRSDSFRGVMEFLIATTAQRTHDDGAQYLSLSGAPLARLDRGLRVDALQHVLDLTGRALEPVYGFGSLLAFKAKFQPEYHPLYMAYPDPAALPAIAAAIARAYLPDAGPRDLARLVGRLAHMRQ